MDTGCQLDSHSTAQSVTVDTHSLSQQFVADVDDNARNISVLITQQPVEAQEIFSAGETVSNETDVCLSDVADVTVVGLDADIEVGEDTTVDTQHLVLAATSLEDESPLPLLLHILVAALGRIPVQAAKVGRVAAKTAVAARRVHIGVVVSDKRHPDDAHFAVLMRPGGFTRGEGLGVTGLLEGNAVGARILPKMKDRAALQVHPMDVLTAVAVAPKLETYHLHRNRRVDEIDAGEKDESRRRVS